MKRPSAHNTKTLAPRVFVLEPHNKDLRSAEKFGVIEFIFDGQSSRPSIWDAALTDAALGYLHARQYDPDFDYVLAVGALVPLTMFFTALVETYSAPLVLYFDAVNRCYVERRLGRNVAEPAKWEEVIE